MPIGRALFVLFSLVLLTLPCQAADESKDGNFLLRACKELIQDSRPHIAQRRSESISLSSWCAGFLSGMMGMNSIYQGVMSEEAGFFCFPERELEVDQAARIVVKYLEQHSEEQDLPARSVGTFALNAAFPCKGETKPPNAISP